MQDILAKIDSEKAKLATLNQNVNDIDSEAAVQIQNLNKKWNLCIENVTNKISDIEKGCYKYFVIF